MTASHAAPFASWPSPITAERVAAAQTGLLDVLLDDDDVWWVESRPQEAGRHVLVRQRHDGTRADMTPSPMSARTPGHEYGGGAVAVTAGITCFSNFEDQQLYRLDADGTPVALTPAPEPGHGDPTLRYADGRIDAARHLWIGVREDQRPTDREAVNTLVALDIRTGGAGTVLVEGSDFYAFPR